MVKYVLSWINHNSSVADIIKYVNILMAIQWVQKTSKEVSSSTLTQSFEKFGFRKNYDDVIEGEEEDVESLPLGKELYSDLSVTVSSADSPFEQ